jgi:hypothetical protein
VATIHRVACPGKEPHVSDQHASRSTRFSSDSPPAAPLGWLVARFVDGGKRRATDEALAGGTAREIAREDLLAEERLPDLARQSLWLLAAGGLVFGALDAVAWRASPRARMKGRTLPGQIGRIVAGNLLGYVLMLPLHEAAHAGAILALGGRPRFGAHFPFALYCSAPGQIFTRDGYTFVLLTPLVALSAIGAALTWRSPVAGAMLLFALAGNVSGCVADLAATRTARRLPRAALIADTEAGYIAYLADLDHFVAEVSAATHDQ